MYDYIKIMENKKLCLFESPIRSSIDNLIRVSYNHKCHEFDFTDSVGGVFPICTPVIGYIKSMSIIMTLLDPKEYKPNSLGTTFFHSHLIPWNSNMWGSNT